MAYMVSSSGEKGDVDAEVTHEQLVELSELVCHAERRRRKRGKKLDVAMMPNGVVTRQDGLAHCTSFAQLCFQLCRVNSLAQAPVTSSLPILSIKCPDVKVFGAISDRVYHD